MNKRRHFRKKTVIWITDPWEKLEYADDTALRLMEECAIQGHRTYWSTPGDFSIVAGELKINAKRLVRTTHSRAQSSDFQFESFKQMPLSRFDTVFYRLDPPVDERYLQPLRLLQEFSKKAATEFINPISILSLSSEKFIGLSELKSLYPSMIITSNIDALKTYGIDQGKTIAKLLNTAQSKEIHLLNWETEENQKASISILQQMTKGFSIPVLLQEFFPEVAKGEMRLWFVDGKLIAHIIKTPARGEFIINLWKGGGIETRALTPKEKKASAKIASYLKKNKIRMAAVDLISGYITDFNFTSPSLITEMERFYERNIGKEIIESLFSN